MNRIRFDESHGWSHVFNVLVFESFGVIDAVTRQWGRNEGAHPGVAPVDAINLPHVLLPAQVVVSDVVSFLVRRLPAVQVHCVVHREGSDEEEPEDTGGGDESHAKRERFGYA